MSHEGDPPLPPTSSQGTNEPISKPNSSLRVTRKPTRKRAPFWADFNKIIDAEGRPKASCNFCRKEYHCHSKLNGTSNVRNHWIACPLNPKNNDPTQSILNLQPNSKGTDKVLTSWKFNQDEIRKALTRMVIVDELPFRFVECEGFRNFMSVACPIFRIPSRWTVARDCFDIYSIEKSKFKTYLKESKQMVCLTTDSWTSLQKINYMCLTVHYINEAWELKKKIINFCPISSHKGEAIGKAVENCLLEWGIDRVFTITVDNASSNDVAISYLSKKIQNWGNSILNCKYLHMRCIAHIINLVVVDGLKLMSPSVSRIRNAIRYVRHSPSRFQKFKECVEAEKIQSKKLLCLDVSTRWNSTFMMLDTAQRFETAFERFTSIDPWFRVELAESGGYPNDDDWSNARRLCTFLEHFYQLTMRISGSLYVTCNNFFDEITSVDILLRSSKESSDFDLANMADKMREKYEKYWGDIEKMNMVIFIAPIFDPRHKLEYVEYALDQLYGTDKSDSMKKKVKSVLYSMFNEYKNKGTSEIGSTSTTTIDRVQPVHTLQLKKFMKAQFKKHKMELGGGDTKSELDRYLDESTVDDDDDDDESDDFNLLGWWKLNSPRFPILSKMARDILAVPISTVASESAFSTGGRVLDEYRSSLTPKIAQALICCQDWFRGPSDRPIVSIVEEDFEDIYKVEMGNLDFLICIALFKFGSIVF